MIGQESQLGDFTQERNCAADVTYVHFARRRGHGLGNLGDVLLFALDHLHEAVEQVLGVRRASPGLGVELRREDGPTLVHDTLCEQQNIRTHCIHSIKAKHDANCHAKNCIVVVVEFEFAQQRKGRAPPSRDNLAPVT